MQSNAMTTNYIGGSEAYSSIVYESSQFLCKGLIVDFYVSSLSYAVSTAFAWSFDVSRPLEMPQCVTELHSFMLEALNLKMRVDERQTRNSIRHLKLCLLA